MLKAGSDSWKQSEPLILPTPEDSVVSSGSSLEISRLLEADNNTPSLLTNVNLVRFLFIDLTLTFACRYELPKPGFGNHAVLASDVCESSWADGDYVSQATDGTKIFHESESTAYCSVCSHGNDAESNHVNKGDYSDHGGGEGIHDNQGISCHHGNGHGEMLIKMVQLWCEPRCPVQAKEATRCVILDRQQEDRSFLIWHSRRQIRECSFKNLVFDVPATPYGAQRILT